MVVVVCNYKGLWDGGSWFFDNLDGKRFLFFFDVFDVKFVVSDEVVD